MHQHPTTRLRAASVRWIALAFFAAVVAQAAPLEELVLPVRVHLLSAEVAEELNAASTEEEIRQKFLAVNGIWKQAGIRWEIESIVSETAANQDTYAQWIELDDRRNRQKRRPVMMGLLSPEHRLKDGWNLYVIRRFPIPASGVYFPELGSVLYAELGRRGETHATVLAHELGHALSLPHTRGVPRNLMRAGGRPPTTAAAASRPANRGATPPPRDPGQFTELTDQQITAARVQAQQRQPFPGRGRTEAR